MALMFADEFEKALAREKEAHANTIRKFKRYVDASKELIDEQQKLQTVTEALLKMYRSKLEDYRSPMKNHFKEMPKLMTNSEDTRSKMQPTEIWYHEGRDQTYLVEWNPCRCHPNDTIITWGRKWKESGSFSWKDRAEFESYMKSWNRIQIA
ncbi:MAG: hypothetical protein EOP06_18375 [Proteobacteria bacterium]|nr:MAG: hypothetical protein EOP06_18375 [Pseudomonadota bacterium]